MKESPRMWIRATNVRSVMVFTAVITANAADVRADSEPVDVAVQWTLSPGAQTCMPGPVLARRAGQRLRLNRLVDADTAQVILRGRTEPTTSPPGFIATIDAVTRDGQVIGHREIAVAGDNCSDLDDSLVLVLTMMADASLADRVSEPAPKSPAPSPPMPTRKPANLQRAAPAPLDPPWSLALSTSAQAEFGRLPEHPLAVSASVSAHAPSGLVLDLTLSAWSLARADADDGGVRLRAYDGTAQLCAGFVQLGRLRTLGCLGARIGLLSARGSGFVDNRQPLQWSADAQVGPTFLVDLSSRWFVRASGAGLLALRRPRFVFETSTGVVEPLYQGTAVAGSAHFGFGFRFR